jgi:hypothetical protein
VTEPSDEAPGPGDGVPDLEGAMTLDRLRAIARQELIVDDPRTELLAGLEAPSEAWQLVALQGLERVVEPADLVDAAAVLVEEALDPLLLGQARLALARAGARGLDVDDLAGRALGQRGEVDDGAWPLRAWIGRRTGIGWPARRMATLGLGALVAGRGRRAEAARSALRTVLVRDPDWAVREAAATALGRSRARPDREVLEGALADRRLAVRSAAAAALERAEPAGDDDPDAWRNPGGEPCFRYLGRPARRDYVGELGRGARDGRGRNWRSFDSVDDDDPLDPGGEAEAPADVDPLHPLVLALNRRDGVTCARDLAHHPPVRWAVDPTWPVCCGDYALFLGHDLAACVPPGDDVEEWFCEALDPDLPLPEEGLEELEAETYAFRCGRCGWFWTAYRER